MTREYGHDRDSKLPPYQPSESASSRGGSASNARSRPEPQEDYDEPPQRDRRGAYALQVQRACSNALRSIQQDNQITASSWAEPLTAAPAAISVMAFLMKTAANPHAAGCTIESLEVMNGNEKVGQLT
jgi:hypothetical protein